MAALPDIYEDARAYDLLFGDYAHGEDLAFYTRLAREVGGPTLELGCGTGRLTIPLAESGVEMTGLDLSSPMLTLARQKAASRNVGVTWVEADFRSFALGRTFGLVFVPANSLTNLLDRESLEGFFRSVREHLAPGGRLALQIYNPSLTVLMRDASQRYPVGQFQHPDSGRTVVVTHTHVYDAATQINHILWHYQTEGAEEQVASLKMRVFYPQEIDALLYYNGFTSIAKYGDWGEAPFITNSTKQVIVCAPSGGG